MRHVSLEAERLRAIDHLEELHHLAPAMHAAPADFAFGREPFAEILRDAASFTKGFGDELRVALRVFGPITHTGRGIDADDAVRTNAKLAQLACDATGLEHLAYEILPIVRAAHCRTAAGGLPYGCHDRAHDKTQAADFLGELFQVVVADVNTDVWVVKEQVHAIKFDAVDRSVRG